MFIWISVLVLASVLSFLIGRPGSARPPISTRSINLVRVVVFSLAVLSPLYYEFPGHQFAVVKFDGPNTTVKPYGAFCLEYFGSCSNIPRQIETFGSVHPITENPKVRELKYRLNVTVQDPNRFFLDPTKRHLWSLTRYIDFGMSSEEQSPEYGYVSDEMARIVLNELYRFNNIHSRELGEFYNPLDESQVQTLKNLIEPWVNERIADYGLRVKLTGFSVS